MAKKLKTEVPGVAPNDLKRVVKDILRHKANASENSGLAGQATKQACEQYSLDKKALGLVVGLSKQNDVAKAQSTLRAIVDYADKLGMFDQVDFYDDLIPTMERIIERAKNTRPAAGAPGGEDERAPAEGLGAAPVH